MTRVDKELPTVKFLRIKGLNKLILSEDNMLIGYDLENNLMTFNSQVSVDSFIGEFIAARVEDQIWLFDE